MYFTRGRVKYQAFSEQRMWLLVIIQNASLKKYLEQWKKKEEILKNISTVRKLYVTAHLFKFTSREKMFNKIVNKTILLAHGDPNRQFAKLVVKEVCLYEH